MALNELKKTLFISNPELEKEWDYEENIKEGLIPEKLYSNSSKRAHWICPKGHKYEAYIYHRAEQNTGCSICAGKKILIGYNDLATTRPDLLKEWDFDKNNELGFTPQNVMAGTNKKVWWICPKSHHYEAYINNRTKQNTGCPFCAGQKILVGYNDLATTRPDLLKEWDYKRNNKLGITPQNVMMGSNVSAHWICPFGHNYEKVIHARSSGQGCTICSQESQTSFPEQALYYYISKVYPETKNRYGKPEIDVYIPNLKLGIEYDGEYAHRNKRESELKKDKIIKSQGIYLIRIKEVKKLENDKNNVIYCKPNSNNTFLNNVIIKLQKIINDKYNLNVDFQPNILKDRIKIEEQYLSLKKQNSIMTLYPNIAKEWDFDKNGAIKPEYISYGSSKKYYWICPKGHSYECSPKDRVHGRGCNICSGIRYIKRTNDLQTKHPELIKYWDFDKNEVTPDSIKYTNSDVHWWKCNKGHSYQATIKTMLKYKCCLGCSENLNILVKGVNDLATLNPKLIEEWDYENNDKTPDCYTLNSNQEVYWVCKKCGNHWKSYINQRSVCPNCKKINNKINVYDSITLNFLFSVDGITKFCEKLNVDINKQHGNISQVCHRKQKTIMGKYVLRYDNDDEFKGLSIQKRKEIFNYDITKVQRNNTINVYDIGTAKLIGSFNDKRELCKNLNVDYKKQHGNISTICKRKQKTLLGKYILRYDYDDEFKKLSNNQRIYKIEAFMNMEIN